MNDLINEQYSFWQNDFAIIKQNERKNVSNLFSWKFYVLSNDNEIRAKYTCNYNNHNKYNYRQYNSSFCCLLNIDYNMIFAIKYKTLI
jgi:hypothetical protein